MSDNQTSRVRYKAQTICLGILALTAGVKADIAAFHGDMPMALAGGATCIILFGVAAAFFCPGALDNLKGKRGRHV